MSENLLCLDLNEEFKCIKFAVYLGQLQMKVWNSFLS